MTIQITVRLPAALVHEMDARVEVGQAKSRAAVVAAALERESRRLRAERDAKIYRETGGDDPDLVELSDWASRTPLDLD